MKGDPAESTPSRISNGVVQVFKQATGRGPTKARTHISDNLITVLMEDVLTELERGLVERGGDQARDELQALRLRVQRALRTDLVALVEAETGREVVAFMSANHLEPDMALESFVLAPRES